MKIEYISDECYFLASCNYRGRVFLSEGATWSGAFRGCIAMIREAA